MVQMLRGAWGEKEISKWTPWVLSAMVALYLVGYVDGSIHGVALGDSSMKLNYVHEFFHHARHVALMCH